MSASQWPSARDTDTGVGGSGELAPARGAFERHLREAIALNRARAPRYAALSGGESSSISWSLIAAEVMLLPVARWFDWRAAPYHRAGIPVLESLFVSMSNTPPFVEDRAPVATTTGIGGPPREIGHRVALAFRTGGFAAASEALTTELRALATTPHESCLVRHLLESAHRLTQLAPSHVGRAMEVDLPTPAPLLGLLLRMHLWALGPAGRLDRRARPLQHRGIAILAQDLPPIPSSLSASE